MSKLFGWEADAYLTCVGQAYLDAGLPSPASNTNGPAGISPPDYFTSSTSEVLEADRALFGAVLAAIPAASELAAQGGQAEYGRRACAAAMADSTVRAAQAALTGALQAAW